MIFQKNTLYDYQYIVQISRIETRSNHIENFRCRAGTYAHHVQYPYIGRWAAKNSINIFGKIKQYKNTLNTNNCIIAKKTRKTIKKSKFSKKKKKQKH